MLKISKFMCIDITTKKFEGVMLFFEKYRNEGFGLDFLFKFWFFCYWGLGVFFFFLLLGF